jgi:hypothetical protein
MTLQMELRPDWERAYRFSGELNYCGNVTMTTIRSFYTNQSHRGVYSSLNEQTDVSRFGMKSLLGEAPLSQCRTC